METEDIRMVNLNPEQLEKIGKLPAVVKEQALNTIPNIPVAMIDQILDLLLETHAAKPATTRKSKKDERVKPHEYAAEMISCAENEAKMQFALAALSIETLLPGIIEYARTNLNPDEWGQYSGVELLHIIASTELVSFKSMRDVGGKMLGFLNAALGVVLEEVVEPQDNKNEEVVEEDDNIFNHLPKVEETSASPESTETPETPETPEDVKKKHLP